VSTYTVAVRALCEFTAKRGDLDLRFTPAPTAQEGIAGHGVVAARRGSGYRSEVSLVGEHKTLRVRGRADGYDEDRNLVEEVKTFRGDLARQPDNHRQLHWAQAKVYGALLCQEHGLAQINVALVYFDVASQRETVLSELHSAAALQEFFEAQCECFLQWSQQEVAHREVRDAALVALKFPHADFRPGQRPLSEAVYRAAGAGRCLMAQAPTGIGKTVGTLFPLLKACGATDPVKRLDKIFYLAAKTPGRALALEALHTIGEPNVRVIELVARDKACEHPDKACHGDSCPLAKGFYDRLPAARSEALTVGPLDQAAVRRVALQHQVCPYYLSQELVRWADVVVGDYNYWFDLSAMLYGLTLANDWRVGVLVDEAHNLVERGRKMYSAELHQDDLSAVKRTAPPAVKLALGRLNRAWNTLNKAQEQPWQVYASPPDELQSALQKALAAIGDHWAEHPADTDAPLLNFYLAAIGFSRVLELLDSNSQFDVTLVERGGNKRPRSRLCLRNIIPAPFLKPRFAASRSTTLFSATLGPQQFYADMLGLPEGTPWVDVESPFHADQLVVRIASHISTRYQQRGASVAPIVELMAKQYAEAPGNYLAFFSSFEYLQQVAERMAALHPDVPQWAQSRQMDEAARTQFLARFTAEGRGVGFAVLGGAFAEGIDLPGRRLIGAFVATLGLPQVNEVNESMKGRMQAAFGAGYDYTYLYPGLQKVVQAAGRVIRTTSDRGVVYLIDDRFGRSEVRRLLPAWWRVERAPRVAVRPWVDEVPVE
jgi:Rad3-related DNA helicase